MGGSCFCDRSRSRYRSTGPASVSQPVLPPQQLLLTPTHKTTNHRRATAEGLLDTTLRILPVRVADGPVAYSSRAYEGTVPGPTLMLKPGDTMRLLQVG